MFLYITEVLPIIFTLKWFYSEKMFMNIKGKRICLASKITSASTPLNSFHVVLHAFQFRA